MMRKQILINQNWQFHLGELSHKPLKMAKKAYALGGFTASLPNENGQRLPISAGGEHFLKLIAQGNIEIGLRNLCGTDLESAIDDSWQTINLPHDWKVALPYEDNPMNLMSGSKPDGEAYYRKTFSLDALAQDTRLILHFDGVTRMADVWLNGAYLGHNNSGYTAFTFDITEMARYGDEGENTLLVRAETTSGPEGWWYEGAGITKSVYLEYVPVVRIDFDSAYVYTKSLQDSSAILGVEFTVNNESDEDVEAKPIVSIDGQDITFDHQYVKAGQQKVFKAEVTVENVRLWSPETPNLYKASFSLNQDVFEKTFGIRTFAYDQTGFHLNGQPYELHGVCEHQDFAGVGVALNQDILDYKMKVLKDMGVNAYRSAHHFASKELLSACDRYGILVMNENRIPESTPWRINDLKKMVIQSRMHASIAFWSIGNEELVGNTSYGSRTIKRLASIIRQHDAEHLIVSAELLNPEGKVDEDYLKYVDILGVNYPEAGVMGAGAEIIHQNHPTLPMMSTENASYFSTRGIYKDNAEKCQCNNFGSMYSMILPGKRQPGDPGVGGTAHPEDVIHYFNTHRYMGGVFIWTAFDYFGEPSPFGYPGIGSQFGICDVNGFPKDYYYYYKSHWTDKPTVHLMPHWNQEGLEINENGQVAVRVFSNGDTVELFINGISQGTQVLKDCTANYLVDYQPGCIEVVAYKDNQEFGRDKRITSNTITTIKQETIFAGHEVDLICLTAIDNEGHEVPTANNLIHLTVNNGNIIGLGNGNPADTSDFSLENITLFSGKALAIVKKREGNPQLIVTLDKKNGTEK